MAYAPLNWQEGITKLGPTNLNHLEGGVAVADANALAALAPRNITFPDATVQTTAAVAASAPMGLIIAMGG